MQGSIHAHSTTEKPVSDAPGPQNQDEVLTGPKLSSGLTPHSFEIQVRATSPVKGIEDNRTPCLPMLLRIRTEWVAIVLLALLLGTFLACTLFPVRIILPVFPLQRLAHDECVAARCCNYQRLACKEYASD